MREDTRRKRKSRQINRNKRVMEDKIKKSINIVRGRK